MVACDWPSEEEPARAPWRSSNSSFPLVFTFSSNSNRSASFFAAASISSTLRFAVGAVVGLVLELVFAFLALDLAADLLEVKRRLEAHIVGIAYIRCVVGVMLQGDASSAILGGIEPLQLPSAPQ